MNSNELFKKLNYKDQGEAVILNAPEEFKASLSHTEFGKFVQDKFKAEQEISFILCFVQHRNALEKQIESIVPHLKDDVLLWFAYPKKSSKNYDSDISRDKGWESLGKYKYEPVRLVSIDDDWSAMRFRHLDYIKELKRNPKMLLSNKKP